MKENLNILHLEDNSLDQELIQSIIKKEYPDCIITVCFTKNDFVNNLKKNIYDIILADYDLPAFDGLNAFKITKQINPLIPFIFVTGKISEDAAIEAIKEGADDYVFKDKLNKLIPTINKTLQYKKNSNKYKEIEIKYKLLIDNSKEAITWINDKGDILFANKTAASAFKKKPEEIISKKLWELFPKNKAIQHFNSIKKTITTKTPIFIEDDTIINNEKKIYLTHLQPIIKDDGTCNEAQVVSYDVTAEKLKEKALNEIEFKFSKIVENSI